jgi:hypothetical protein
MDKLEHYLDQVCRGIAGPRSLRNHIRRELREHLLDAADEHRGTGASDADALERALLDFGGPELVRADLLAAHGQRVVAVIVDKAMSWKEKTMKAKWVWTTWVHIVLALLIAMEVATVAMAVTFIVPKVQQISLNAGAGERGLDALLPGSQRFLELLYWLSHNGLWLILGLAFAWALFEWRLRSENKTMMRLSAMGTTAVALMVLVFFSAAVSSIPLAIAAPMLESQHPEALIADPMSRLDISMGLLDRSVADENWNLILKQAEEASRASFRLTQLGAAAPAILSSSQPQRVDDLRQQLESTNQCLRDLQNAALDKDHDRLRTVMQKLHDTYGHIQAATKPST